MTAREIMCRARDAVQLLRDQPGRLEAKRELCALRARPQGPRGRGGVSDPTKRIDDLIVSEESAGRDAAQARRDVAYAASLLRGLGEVDPGGASVLRLRFLMLHPWRDIASVLGVTVDEAREMASVGMDIIDANGPAAVREGRLTVTGAVDAD